MIRNKEELGVDAVASEGKGMSNAQQGHYSAKDLHAQDISPSAKKTDDSNQSMNLSNNHPKHGINSQLPPHQPFKV